MASSRRRRKLRLWRQSRNSSTALGRIPWRLMFFTCLLYAAAGLVLGAFPIPYWLWALAGGGVIAQAVALAGPMALGRLSWWKANALVLLAILGAGALVVALGIALGFAGTDNLDQIEFQATVFETIQMGLLALAITALSVLASAATGDRLLYTFNRLRTGLILAATGILGLGLGGLLGVLVVR